MKQVPDSLLAFQHMFPDDDACAAWLIEMRWPGGFRCPECGHDKGWALRSKAHTFECAGCRRQTSVTAGTILHGSKLPLTVWFWAVYLMATIPTESPRCNSRNSSVSARTEAPGCSHTQAAYGHGRPRAQPAVGSGRDRRGQPSLPDQERSPCRWAGPQPRRQDADRRRHRTRGRKHARPSAGWPNSPPTVPPTSDLRASSKPPPIPTPLPRTDGWSGYVSVPQTATKCMSSARPPLISSFPGSTRSSQTSRDGHEASTTGCAASTCRPTSTSSSFASTDAKLRPRRFPLALRSRPQRQSPHLQNVEKAGAMCISGSRN